MQHKHTPILRVKAYMYERWREKGRNEEREIKKKTRRESRIIHHNESKSEMKKETACERKTNAHFVFACRLVT